VAQIAPALQILGQGAAWIDANPTATAHLAAHP
jgi:hypothetical protein